MLTPDLAIASLRGSGNVQLAAANLVTGSDNSNQTYSGVISGWGGVTKIGSGTWTLTGTNTYSGNTLVSQGTLQVGANLALQNSTFDTTGSGTLAFSPGVTAASLGGLTGAGNLTLPSSVTSLTLDLGSGVTQSYSGAGQRGQIGSQQDGGRHASARRHERLRRHYVRQPGRA